VSTTCQDKSKTSKTQDFSALRRSIEGRHDALVDALARQRLETLLNPPKYEFDGRVVFHPNWVLSVPPTPGCYVIADIRGPLYVGRSTSLRQRFAEHQKRSHNPLLRVALETPWGTPEFSWALQPVEGLPDVEAALITALQPLCNQNVTLLTVNPAAAGCR